MWRREDEGTNTELIICNTDAVLRAAVTPAYFSTLGGDSIKIFWLAFRLEKRIEIPF